MKFTFLDKRVVSGNDFLNMIRFALDIHNSYLEIFYFQATPQQLCLLKKASGPALPNKVRLNKKNPYASYFNAFYTRLRIIFG